MENNNKIKIVECDDEIIRQCDSKVLETINNLIKNNPNISSRFKDGVTNVISASTPSTDYNDLFTKEAE